MKLRHNDSIQQDGQKKFIFEGGVKMTFHFIHQSMNAFKRRIVMQTIRGNLFRGLQMEFFRSFKEDSPEGR